MVCIYFPRPLHVPPIEPSDLGATKPFWTTLYCGRHVTRGPTSAPPFVKAEPRPSNDGTSSNRQCCYWGYLFTIGPVTVTVEQQCYQLQRPLTSDEKRVWSAAANALPEVADDAIRARKTAAAAATLTPTGRQSLSSPVSVDERDLGFEPRLAHLLTFLKDQPGHPPAGGRRQPARAAAISESADAETAPLHWQPALSSAWPPCPNPGWERCRGQVYRRSGGP